MNVYGETPLHAAAKGKLGNVAKILLNQGANPNIQVFNKTRFSPLTTRGPPPSFPQSTPGNEVF